VKLASSGKSGPGFYGASVEVEIGGIGVPRNPIIAES
jgi:hypothetical protein